jgi:hypothetical protein
MMLCGVSSRLFQTLGSWNMPYLLLPLSLFSATLIDRVADVLFGMTALVSVAANARTFLKH